MGRGVSMTGADYMKRSLCLVVVAGSIAALSGVAQANVVTNFQTITDTDWTHAEIGGLRNGSGSGSLAVAGISGTVTKAYLYWHGPTDVASPTANASITFNGSGVVGTNIGTSQDNNWGFLNSQAYRADVTSLVTGNGAYSFANLVKTDVQINGLSLLVFFNDGNASNNRDVVLFDGNDSNISSAFDPEGWQASLSGINYSGGTASVLMGVSDGQNFGNDEALKLNGTELYGVGPTWNGTQAQNGLSGFPSNGLLWDVRTFDVTSFLSLGPNTLSLVSNVPPLTDALSLIHLAFDLPVGAAPPTVPLPPAVWGGLGLLGLMAVQRRTRKPSQTV